jgi:hypothetical protein
MIIDEGTMLAIIIALGLSCGMMGFLMYDNYKLRETVHYLLKKEDNNG